MPSSSFRLRMYSPPSAENAEGGARVTKLWDWREVCMGETGETAGGFRVGPGGVLEVLSSPEVRLSLSLEDTWTKGEQGTKGEEVFPFEEE